MKNYFLKFCKPLLLFAILFFCKQSFAQNFSSGIGITGGYTEGGGGFLVNYNYHIDRQDFIQGGVFVGFNSERVRDITVPYSILTANVAYLTKIYSTFDDVFRLYIGGGLLAGQETINRGRNVLEDGAVLLNDSNFIWGAFSSLEGEILLNDEWSFIIKYNQYLHLNSDLGLTTPFIGLGVRYFLF